MNAYVLPLSCPRCGDPMQHVTGSIITGTEASAVARCMDCRKEYAVVVRLLPVESPYAAAQRRHRARKKEAVV